MADEDLGWRQSRCAQETTEPACGWRLVGCGSAALPARDAAPDGAPAPDAAEAAAPDAAPIQAACGTFVTRPGAWADHIVTDDATLYWSQATEDGGSVIRKVAKLGGPVKDIAVLDRRLDELIIDGQDLFASSRVPFTDYESTRLQRIAVDGLELDTLVTEPFTAFAVGGDGVYWSHTTDQGDEIKRIARHGGTAQIAVAADGDFSIDALATDTTHLYYGYGSGVNRVPLAGGPYQPVVNGQGSAGRIVVDGDLVYWEGSYIYVVRKPATDAWSSGWNLDLRRVTKSFPNSPFLVVGSRIFFEIFFETRLLRGVASVGVADGVETVAVPSDMSFAVDESGIYFQGPDLTIRHAPLSGCP